MNPRSLTALESAALNISRGALLTLWQGRDRSLDPMDALLVATIVQANVDVAMSVLDQDGLGDWLAERLVEIGESVGSAEQSAISESRRSGETSSESRRQRTSGVSKQAGAARAGEKGAA